MGKLVEQDPSDDKVNKLLEAKFLGKDSAILEQISSSIAKNSASDKKFPIPDKWQWIQLGNLAPEFQNGASSRGNAKGNPIVVLRLADIENRNISLSNSRTLQMSVDEIEKYKLAADDVLIVRVNGSADLVGNFIVCESDINCIYCDHFIRMRIQKDIYSARFLGLIGASPLVRDQIKSLFVTTAGQKTVNQGHIKSLKIPLLSIDEQHRIVAKVDELMTLCDTIKARIQAANQLQQALADALVSQTLN